MRRLALAVLLLTVVASGALLIVPLIGGTSTAAAEPAEVWVDDDWAGHSPGNPVDGHTFGTDAFANIQDGIDAVASPGTVHVAAGTYVENVNVTKSVSIESEDGAALTIVEAAGGSRVVFMVTADYVNISGFTIGGATGKYGAGIKISGTECCSISDNNLSNNYNGISSYSSNSSSITNNIVNSNASHGIFLYQSDNNNIMSNTLESNGFRGIGLSESDGNTLRDNIANSSGNCGISVYISDNNTLANNTANSNFDGICLHSGSN